MPPRPAAAGFRRRPSTATATSPRVDRLEPRQLFALVTFTVDPALSTLRLSGEVANVFDLEEQGNGSLAAAYQGTIQADVDEDSIDFSAGTSDVVAQSKGNYDPGDRPANYAGEEETDGIFGGVKLGEAAVRGLAFDLRSGSPAPLTESGSFAANLVRFRTTGGRLEYDLVVGGDGEQNLGDQTLDNAAAGNATLRGTGADRTLTIPVDITYGEDDAVLRFRGAIVARAGAGAPVDASAIRIGDGATARGVQFTEADGTLVNVSLRGGGTADLRFENATTQTPGAKGVVVVGGNGVRLAGIDAVGTTGATKLAITGKGGADGAAAIGGVTTDGALAALGGRGAGFAGTVAVNGPVGTFTAANLSGATVTADAVGKFAVSGDVTGSTVTLDAPFAAGAPAVRTFTVGGTMAGSRLATTSGDVGNVKVGALTSSEVYAGLTGTPTRLPTAAEAAAGRAVGNVTAKTFSDSVIAGDTLGRLKLGTVAPGSAAGPFGVAGDFLAGLQARSATGERLRLAPTDDPAALSAALAAQPFSAGPFTIQLA